MPTPEVVRNMKFDPRTCPACLKPKPLLALDDVRGSASGFGSPRSVFIRAQKIERAYSSRLRSIAKHVGDIVRSFDLTSGAGPSLMERALQRYANTLTPWAEAAARLMTTEVAARDERSWFRAAATMGRELKKEIANAPTGQVMQALQTEQVVLIRSLPLEAAERVQRLARESLSSGSRPETLAAEIMRTQEVTAARARTIARTETSRAATVLTQARAQHIGSEGYFWTTANDSDVRASHKAMSGKFVRWDSPPTLDGLTGHAGALPNCFVGDTKVSLANGLSRIWRVPFNGEVVEIATAVASVAVTPNHPILTRRGWVPAGEIQEGDHLIQAVNDACVIVDRNEDHLLPTFDEVFGAFAVNQKTVSGFGFNFYGDIPNGDVDIVSVNGLLSDDRVPETFKSIRDLALPDADGGVADFIIVSGNDHVAEPLPSSLGHQGFSLIVGEAAHADEVGLTAIPSLNAVLLKAPADCEPSHSVFLRQSQLTGSSQILANDIGLRKVCNSVVAAGVRARNCDPASPELLAEIVGVDADSERGVFETGARKYQPLRVLNVGRRDFLGHVFTIQTLNGWYSVTSAGIIAKNCRCHPTPQIPDL